MNIIMKATLMLKMTQILRKSRFFKHLNKMKNQAIKKAQKDNLNCLK